ncbi:probable E3 ubiquitin-protein ligase DTX2 isoform X2 [Protopterus annectens]|uniref:probable E3 ubiquitin-protein ligase DTX2 isoform X2 n=1 Tax=Protopterus annectens TaxID=7888 RepID=UPI001CFC05C3|nr:probable E3 ubiquitin-protein ligase DTX2 isoform X2 [Protopterus annectens]
MAAPPYASGGLTAPSSTLASAPGFAGFSVPSLQMAVWEWMDDIACWRPYSGRVSSFIENYIQNHRVHQGGMPAALSNGVPVPGNSISLGQADPSLAPYIIDVTNMVQFRQDTGTIRRVRRGLFPQSPALLKGVLWEWMNNDGNWTPYQIEICFFLENSYQNRSQNADLIVFNLPYIVDLTTFFQTNKNTHFRRQIQRRTDGTYPLTSSNACSCQHCQSSSGTGPILTRGRHLSHVSNSGQTALASTGSHRSSVIVPYNSNLPYLRRATSFGAGQSSGGAWGVAHSASTGSSASVPAISNGTSILSLSLPSPGPVSSALADMTAMLMSAAGFPVRCSHAQKLASTPASSKKKHASLKKSTKMSKKVAGKEVEDVVRKHVEKIENPPSEDCMICMEKLNSPSGYDGVSESKSFQSSEVGKLMKCSHVFHLLCVRAMYDSGNKDGSLQCPSCKTIYGEKTGTQPSGQMDVYSLPQSLPGHSDCGTLQIIYNIPPGVQGPEHPNPGLPYSARGFPRICFLPDNNKGRKVLQLLKVAWNRRLIFTVGTSTTTGETNTVVWNEIHHKTEMGSNISGHGYPDPNYLDNVLGELAAQGVTEYCLTQDP